MERPPPGAGRRTLHRRSDPTSARSPAAGSSSAPGSSSLERAHVPIDWKSWARAIERRRRTLFQRGAEAAGGNGNAPGDGNGHGHSSPLAPSLPSRHPLSRHYLARVTRASFGMDGIDLPERAVADALKVGGAARSCRSRQAQRLRNHVAILRRIHASARRGEPLTGASVVRWYTSVACGLSTARLDVPSLDRLERVARRISSPPQNLRPALEELAALHADLLADPVVPSFNGILARLLLSSHLARCGLPPVLFQPDTDRALPPHGPTWLRRLLELITQSLDALLAEPRTHTPQRQ